MAVSLTWGLDKTAGAALTIARDVFLAANNDNVQPLAIASCEKFGNTIAICEETCRKIESITARTPEPVMIRFIRAYAGFDAADSATQLGKSQAGNQFLALAAALLSLGDLQGPRSLHKMLENSASDKTILPTERQLRDLLHSLGPRLTQSGFLDTIVGWYTFLKQSSVMMEEHGRLIPSLSSCPTPEGVDSLVDAFRKLARIGESDITRVSVYLMDCAPWVIAFTKWCLGMPPSIYLDSGEPILEQPGSRVDLIIPGADKKSINIRVVIHRTLGVLSDLVLQNQSSTPWNGMVSVSQYGQWTLCSYELDTGTAKAALMEALPYAIRRIVHSLRFCKKFEDSRLAEEFRPLSMIPFPEEHIICRTMSQYLNHPDKMVLRTLEGLQIEDLPAMSLHSKALKATCICTKCANLGPKAYSRCFINRFYHRVACVCADILALSLFGNSTLPLLNLYHGRKTESDPLCKIMEAVAFSGEIKFGNVYNLLSYALRLAGHNSSAENDRWVMSSFNGQVIYPSVYETLSYNREGYLDLIWLPGLLRHEDEMYPQVQFPTSEFNTGSLKVSPDKPVMAPCFLIPQVRLIWIVQRHVANALTILLSFQGDEENQEYPVRRTPRNFFQILSSALFLEVCEHDPGTPLESPDLSCSFTSPLTPHPSSASHGGAQLIGVVPVDDSDEMRFLASTNVHRNAFFVVRKRACLSCCLGVCRRASADVLIL